MGLKDLKEMINKFSFAQMTSNSNGKTSASGTMGVLICTIGSISFLYGSLIKDTDILLQSVVFTGIGAGLLGYRKSQDPSKGTEITDIVQDQPLNS
jgi:hypothetical protein